MTAPDNSSRKKYGAVGLDGGVHQCFVESDLMKAANIYQQFDKKGNLYENRLYAKTSINQAKLNKEQGIYEEKMAPHADEVCRINNGSNYSTGMVDIAEKSFNSKAKYDQTNRSIHEMTKQGSGSVYSNIKGSNQS